MTIKIRTIKASSGPHAGRERFIASDELKISYYYVVNNRNKVSSDALDTLEAYAIERIHRQMKDDQTSGELELNFYDYDNDSENQFSGWWTVQDNQEGK